MATQHGQRLVFENAKNLVANAGFNVNQAVLSQSYIRSEIAMSTSTTSYHVPVLVNDTQNGNTFATENRLNLQDAAVISSVGVYVAIPASASTTAFPLYSYPNAVVFSTSGAATALYNLYNGYMQMNINNRVIVPSWGLYKHLAVPQTQQGSQAGATNGGIDQFDGTSQGYYPMEPNVVLVGSKNNQISLNLPSAIGTLQAGVAPRIVVIFQVILAQNVTPVR
jgi:hypothetical protein